MSTGDRSPYKKGKANRVTNLAFLALIIGSLACSLSNIQKQVQAVQQTAGAVRTEIGGVIHTGSSVIKTADAIVSRLPRILQTAKAIATQGAPVISTISAINTSSASMIKTAQATYGQDSPEEKLPDDIPLLSKDQVFNLFGTSQYIFYTTPTQYSQLLKFYQTEMPAKGWQFQEDDSHEYANAAQLVYTKATRTATINLSRNPLNRTCVVVISILSH